LIFFDATQPIDGKNSTNSIPESWQNLIGTDNTRSFVNLSLTVVFFGPIVSSLFFYARSIEPVKYCNNALSF
jgi:hypothetical protein